MRVETIFLASWTVLTVGLPLSPLVANEPESDVLAGHSYHGEAFNEGPRQAAYLMPGMGAIDFPATTGSDLAQKFINQGVAQLHGFWYYEAERSFRQAAVLDPACAIAYWGMAMANQENRERAQKFIAEAVERQEEATPRERLYIQAVESYCKDKDGSGKEIKRKARAQKYTRDLEKIVEEYPDDVEAKAFLAVQLWQNARAELPIVSYVAVNSILQDVFDEQPAHPAHHYRIHLWDRHKPERALQSAAECGPSLPGIAHMWHMPGHIYDRLHRYHDAVWQQEASARVDHAHMMRDRVLPDQIHNFAHNNEWLIRNLLKIGRTRDALSLAKNMQELPRHPKYNSLARGSARYGRERLLLALESYRLWPELIALADTIYLEPTDQPKHQIRRLRDLGLAYALEEQSDKADSVLSELRDRVRQNQQELEELEAAAKRDEESTSTEANQEKKGVQVDKRKATVNRERRKKERETKRKELKDLQKQMEKAVKTVKVALAAGRQQWQDALKGWDGSDLKDNLLKAEWMLAAGQEKDANKLIEDEIDAKPGQLLPLAVKAHVLYQSAGATAAKEAFEQTRLLASEANLDTPLLSRLAPLAAELGAELQWAAPRVEADDIGGRPPLDSLGPFRWQPYLAPDFDVVRSDGQPQRLKNFAGKPTLMIFYLGFGCLHCVEQLHEFSPRARQFRDSGIEVMAISTEDIESLGKALKTYSKPLDIPLHADPQLKTFKAYRCFDDFEQQPLHGTFLVDPGGRVLWQDISYEPFMDVDFVLEESHRLLNLAGYGSMLKTPQPSKLIGSFQELP